MEPVKPKYNATNGMLCWNPETDQVEVGPWPDRTGWSANYKMSALAPTAVKKASFQKRKTIVFIEAVHLIVRDKCDPEAVHKALLNLEEYHDGLSDDFPGVYRADN